jgi:hypothetical protein
MSSIRPQAHGELSRLNVIRLLAFSMLVILPASARAQSPPIAEQVAKTFGLDSFGQIEAIRFTWNAGNPSCPCSVQSVLFAGWQAEEPPEDLDVVGSRPLHN